MTHRTLFDLGVCDFCCCDEVEAGATCAELGEPVVASYVDGSFRLPCAYPKYGSFS